MDRPREKRSIFAVWGWPWWAWIPIPPLFLAAYLVSYILLFRFAWGLDRGPPHKRANQLWGNWKTQHYVQPAEWALYRTPLRWPMLAAAKFVGVEFQIKRRIEIWDGG